jgi:hypothetical protein
MRHRTDFMTQPMTSSLEMFLEIRKEKRRRESVAASEHIQPIPPSQESSAASPDGATNAQPTQL